MKRNLKVTAYALLGVLLAFPILIFLVGNSLNNDATQNQRLAAAWSSLTNSTASVAENFGKLFAENNRSFVTHLRKSWNEAKNMPPPALCQQPEWRTLATSINSMERGQAYHLAAFSYAEMVEACTHQDTARMLLELNRLKVFLQLTPNAEAGLESVNALTRQIALNR